jgi:hypothetical protein
MSFTADAAICAAFFDMAGAVWRVRGVRRMEGPAVLRA